MIPMIFLGIIMNYLGIFQGWLLFWYIVSMMIIAIKNIFLIAIVVDYVDK